MKKKINQTMPKKRKGHSPMQAATQAKTDAARRTARRAFLWGTATILFALRSDLQRGEEDEQTWPVVTVTRRWVRRRSCSMLEAPFKRSLQDLGRTLDILVNWPMTSNDCMAPWRSRAEICTRSRCGGSICSPVTSPRLAFLSWLYIAGLG